MPGASGCRSTSLNRPIWRKCMEPRFESGVVLATGAGCVGPGRGQRARGGAALCRGRPGIFAVDRAIRSACRRRSRGCGTRPRAYASTRLFPDNCTRRWSKRGSPGNVPAATSKRCCASARRAYRWVSWGTGRDTANAALFLASDEARFITGTEIVVDGGMTARCD